MIKRLLTIIDPTTTMPPSGETEVGSVEVQPTRDNQLGVTDYRWGGLFRTACPTLSATTVIQSSPMPKKTSLPKARLSLNRETDLSNSR